jgi:hypothetical protein
MNRDAELLAVVRAALKRGYGVEGMTDGEIGDIDPGPAPHALAEIERRLRELGQSAPPGERTPAEASTP